MALKVFLATPSDTGAEDVVRKKVEGVSKKLIDVGAPGYEFIYWEQLDPALHPNGPQALIDQEIDCTKADFFIAVFANKFGSREPNLNRMTPTEHEVRKAYESFKATGHPQIALFFLEGQPAADTEEEAAQFAHVRKFEAEFREYGLTGRYRNNEALGDAVDSRLWSWAIPYWRQLSKGYPTRLQFSLSNTPQRLCAEGMAELLGNVRIDLMQSSQNKRGESYYDFFVSTSPKINITSRTLTVSASSSTEARLFSESDGVAYQGAPLSESVLLFRRIRLDNLSTTLILSGVRVNATQLNVTRGYANSVELCVYTRESGTDEPPSAPENFSVARGAVAHSPAFDVNFPTAAQLTVQSFLVILIQDERGCWASALIRITERWPRSFEPSVDETDRRTLRSRFRLLLKGVPNGMRIFLSKQSLENDGRDTSCKATLIETDASGNGLSHIRPSNPVLDQNCPFGTVELPVVSSVGWATWEWNGYRQNLNDKEWFEVGLVIQGTPELLQGLKVRLNIQRGPLSTSATGSARASIPRYVEDSAQNFELVLK